MANAPRRDSRGRVAPYAHFAGLWATDHAETVDLRRYPQALEGGFWIVVATFEGAITGYRFGSVISAPLPPAAAPWPGIGGPWESSLDRAAYMAAVEEVRRRIEAGTVYQANMCRILTATVDTYDAPPAARGTKAAPRRTGGDGESEAHEESGIPETTAKVADLRSRGLPTSRRIVDPLALAARLAEGNPAAFQGVLHTGTEWIVTASPELFLSRSGDRLVSAPIKGTAAPGEPFADKDVPENVMICDLVRNDLGRIAVTGSVTVESLLDRQELPGLAHLVSVVAARLGPGLGWGDIFAALLPPGSVSGAPKHTALRAIADLEPVPRGPYCGAIGYIDADAGRAELAVGIRTFHTSDHGRLLHFGTGAGITHLSDPAAEWAETELKAARLISLARGAG